MNNPQDDSLLPQNDLSQGENFDQGTCEESNSSPRPQNLFRQRISAALVLFVAILPLLVLWAAPSLGRDQRPAPKERILLATAFRTPTPTPGPFATATPIVVVANTPVPTPAPTVIPAPTPTPKPVAERFEPHRLMIRNAGDMAWQGYKKSQQEATLGQTVVYEVQLLRASRVYGPLDGSAPTYVALPSTITGNTPNNDWDIRYYDTESYPPQDITQEVTSGDGWSLPFLSQYPSPDQPTATFRIEVTCSSNFGATTYNAQEAVLNVSNSFASDGQSHKDADSVVGLTFIQNRFVPPLHADRDYWVRFHPRYDFPHKMVGGFFQGSHNGVLWDNLAVISSEPTESAYSELPLGTTDYRYFRYLSPNGIEANCSIAELDFYYKGGVLGGNPFGSRSTHLDIAFPKAFDGSRFSYFQARDSDGGYVGIDRRPLSPRPSQWFIGPGIKTRGIHYPNSATGRSLARGGEGRLNAHTAIDWDEWHHDVLREVLGVQTLVREKTMVTDVCTYSWTATAGSFPEGSTGPNVLFKAPNEPGTVFVTLKVEDQDGANLGRSDRGTRSKLPDGQGDIPLEYTVQIEVGP